MDSSNDYLELVHDALYARHMKHVGCFAFNKASERVQEIGAPILPILERVLREEVMPNYPSAPEAQIQKLPGAADLLIDYFRITRDSQMERAAEFFASLRGPVLVEAIRAISVIWEHTIPDPLMSTIETAARTGSPEEQEAASWSLDWHHNDPKAEPKFAAAKSACSQTDNHSVPNQR